MEETKDVQKQENKDTSSNECGVKAEYGYYIAIIGLGIAFILGLAMIFVGAKNDASDIVAVITAITTITGTLVGYFFGEKMGSSGKEKVENKLSETQNKLAESEKSDANKEADYKEELNKSKIISLFLSESQNKIEEIKTTLEIDTKARTRGATDGEEKIQKVLNLLNEAKMPKDVIELLKTEKK